MAQGALRGQVGQVHFLKTVSEVNLARSDFPLRLLSSVALGIAIGGYGSLTSPSLVAAAAKIGFFA